VAVAVAVNSALLAAYFAGRLAGLAILRRHVPILGRAGQASGGPSPETASPSSDPSGETGQPVRVGGNGGDGHSASARRG
jgi:hypothetical protein